jgi:tripartite-type tricarboxylate transporter receptor subunit TctC
MRPTRRALLASALVPLLAGRPAAAQAWPSRPVRLIVPYPPGGQTDIVSRWLGEQLSPVLGQPVVVENRAGAQAIVGITAAKQAAPDGHTVVYVNSSNMAINPFAYTRLPYDPMRDFELVTQIGLATLGMAVPAASGIRSVDEFVQWARANPGKATFASFGAGSSSHLYGEMLKLHAKIDMVHVPYKGAGPAMQDVAAGVASMGIHDFASTLPHVQSGRVVLLAVTGPKRWPLQPDLKTFSELGYPLDVAGWNGIAAPKGTPAAIVERMSAEINRAVQSAAGRQKMLEMGLIATGTTPAEFTRILERDTPRWGEVFRASGVKPQDA